MSETQKQKEPTIILATESVWVSWLRDASSLVVAVAMTGIGRWLQIVPLEWVGAALFILSLLVSASGLKKSMRKSPQQVVDFIAAEYGVYASERKVRQ
jgi:hypothetical protein